MSARATGRGPYRAVFYQALTRMEDAMVGERRPDEPAALAILIKSLEVASGSTAPAAARMSWTPAELHAALFDWQDELELRDGAGPNRHRQEARRPPA